MQRWEYRIVSFQAGRYTEALNEYGREGWELVGVTHDAEAPVAERASGVPMPKVLGRIEDAASRIGTQPAAATTSLLWVLRRPLDD